MMGSAMCAQAQAAWGGGALTVCLGKGWSVMEDHRGTGDLAAASDHEAGPCQPVQHYAARKHN